MPSTLLSFSRLQKFKLLTKFYRLSFFDVILFVIFFSFCYFFYARLHRFCSSFISLFQFLIFFSCLVHFQVLRSRKVQCMLFLKIFQTESILVELKFYCKICCNFFFARCRFFEHLRMN